MPDTDVVPDLTLLPDRRENRVSWAWARFTEDVPVARLVGMFILALATTTVATGLVAGTIASGATAIVLFVLTLVVLLSLGSWLVLMPMRSDVALVAALTLGPVIWTAMLFTWDDGGRVITPIALIYTGACAAAFCGTQVLMLQIALDLGAGIVYIALFGKSTVDVEHFVTDPVLVGRIITYLVALLLFTVGVYLLRRRARMLREGFHARSVLDDLTGLPNRRHVQTISAQLLASGLRQEREVYALVLDIDRLGAVNDEHGPVTGDEVISGVAKVARQALRPEDLLARIGGEELLGAGLVRSQFEAVRIAERLRLAIKRADLAADVTVSVGVATARPGQGVDPVEWIWNLTAVAEESLAAAKASGRDRIASARQNGDVLGDALEVVTARINPASTVAKAPEPLTNPRWARLDGVARIIGGVATVIALACAWWFHHVRDKNPNTVLNDLVVALLVVMLAAGVTLLIRRKAQVDVVAVVIFCASFLWAASCLLIGRSDSFLPVMPAVITCGCAAWLLSRELFTVQLALTFPLMFVVMRSVGLPVATAVLDAVIQAGAVVIAALGLYLMRRNGEELIRQSAELATTDQITGLPNRRLLKERAPAIVAGASRQLVPVSAAVIDLDNFWQINERYGYPAGDKVLAEVGRVLYRTSRAEDTLLRIGGDDFVLISLGDPDEGRRAAYKAAAAVNGIWAYGSPLVCSAGFAARHPEHGSDPMAWVMDLIREATEDLHRLPQADSSRGPRPMGGRPPALTHTP